MEENFVKKFFLDSDFDQLNNLNRWNGLNRIKEETVAHHSYIVSVLTSVYSESCFHDEKSKLEASLYAIFHDFDEMFTGDIIHNVKYDEEYGEEIRESIDSLVRKRCSMKFPSDSPVDALFSKYVNYGEGDFQIFIKRFVKTFDWLSMLYFLFREIMLGNRFLDKHFDYCVENMRKHIGDFIKNYGQRNFLKSPLLEIKNCNYHEWIEK